jgi:hypothetical protein
MQQIQQHNQSMQAAPLPVLPIVQVHDAPASKPRCAKSSGSGSGSSSSSKRSSSKRGIFKYGISMCESIRI